MAKIFYTPSGYSGQSELTASTGLAVGQYGLWTFSQAGYNDGATFGVSLGTPAPLSGGELVLSATDWNIAVVGNELTEFTNPDTGQTYSASQCRIQVAGQWQIVRQQNSNSYNSFNVSYQGTTQTDLGNRSMDPNLLNFYSTHATYTIQGADVTGGAQDTFSGYEFFCNFTEISSSTNSNKEFRSNTIIRPVWAYTYIKSWEIDI